jgi:putative ABC transport system permease protein
MFSFPVIHGNIKSALKEPYSIVLTKSTSQNLYGKENSVGETIHYIGDKMRDGKPEMDLTVTAILEDVPTNSTIGFNALVSFSTLYATKPTGMNPEEDWVNWGYRIYVRLKDQNVQTFQSKLSQLWLEKENTLWPEEDHQKIDIIKFAEVRFYNNNKRTLLFVTQLIGLFILAIAIINFVNLTIAKSASRAKEIGIRKVVGSLRFDLIKQFLVESIMIAVITAPVALVIFELSKSQFYNIINKQIPLNIFNQPFMLLFLLATVLFIGLIAGIYPAFVLSSFKPASIIRGEKTKGKKGASLRFSLLVFQFIISITLITCTILISKQIDFLKTKPLGYSNKNIIYCFQNRQINEKYDVLKQILIQIPNIISMARSNHALGQEFNIGTKQEINGIRKPYRATTVDPDFIPTMGIEIMEGRPFSWEIPTDKHNSIIVNESFVREFELDSPIGAEIDFLDFLHIRPKIIGVVKDFHYDSFYHKLEPSALWYADWNSNINIKISDRNQSQTIKYIEKVWNELSPQTPFEYEFLDATYDKLYKAEEELKQIVIIFSLISILITYLGLFGLISYSAVQRTKEIGIRKVLGASITNLIGSLTRDYFRWIIIAVLIACPISYYAMNKWLQNFAYHIEMSWWMFALAGAIALMIALLTVSCQVIRAATANPVEALRYE